MQNVEKVIKTRACNLFIYVIFTYRVNIFEHHYCFPVLETKTGNETNHAQSDKRIISTTGEVYGDMYGGVQNPYYGGEINLNSNDTPKTSKLSKTEVVTATHNMYYDI